MGRPGRVKRACLAAYAGLAIGYVVVLVRNRATPDILAATDFTVFWSAWHMVLHGGAPLLYDEASQRATQKLLLGGGYFEGGLMAFLNPPHFALATAPFGWLAEHGGEPLAFLAWTACNLALLALLVRALLKEWGADTRQHRAMIVVSVIAFYPVFVTVKNGQISLALALAVLGVYRAAKAARPWAAGAWLTVLTIKPQLVPMVVIYLVAQRSWHVLGAAAVVGAGVFAATTLALGPGVWIEYLRHVHYLEQFWGSGTPDYMLNARGELTRLFGVAQSAAIDTVSYGIWLAAMALAVIAMWRRRGGEERDTRPEYAYLMALGLVANPHLFSHDTVIWTVPLVLCAAAMRDAGRDWVRFARFALAWPAIFAVAGRLDIRSGPLTWLDLHTWTFVVAVVLIARQLPRPERSEQAAYAPRLHTANLYRSWTS